MRRLVMSRSTATLREAKRPSYTTVVSLRSEISGRTSPDLSSDMNGSRPPPSYANTSRISDAAGTAVESRSCAAAGLANVTAASASATLPTRTRGSRGPGYGRRGRLHERPNRELGQEQRARGVAEQLLRGGRRGRQHDILRHDDARQGRDVGEIFADLVVMAVDLEPVAVGVERRARLGTQRLNLADGDAPHLRLRRDVIDQRRHFVALRHQAAHQLERALIFLHAAAQIFDAAARQVGFGRRDDLLEAVGFLIRRSDRDNVGLVLLGPEEVAPGQRRAPA